MAAEESAERLKKSRIDVDYWWFDLEDLKEMVEYIEKLEGEGTLRAVPGLDEDGHPDLHLVIYDSKNEYVEQCNTSHPCPPSC